VLLHVPPADVLVSPIVLATHTLPLLVIVPAFGNGLTVIVAFVLTVPHPLVTIYVITALPADTPVSILPDIDTVPLALLQVPPADVLVSPIVLPTHTLPALVIVPALGSGLIVIVAFVLAVPQPLVTI
jgi:hypothetical protein